MPEGIAMPSSGPSPRLIAAGVATVVAIIFFALFALSGFGLARMDAGHVGVVRNGGPLDDKNIRQILQPGQSLTWTGWLSEDPHAYPASNVQRFYTITSDRARGDRQGSDIVRVPTRDGVQVGIEGTLYFNFVGESNERLLQAFDNNFGTRTFPTVEAGDRRFPWEGDEGFSAMLDTILRPVILNDLREEVGQKRCQELISSCALISRGEQAATPVADENSNANLQEIQRSINESLTQDIQSTLGGGYFTNIRFNLSRVTLPENVQRAIDEAQSAFAEVSRARARVRQAEFQNRANRLLARTYSESPELAQIEAIKAIPEGAEVIFNLNGTGSSPGLTIPNRR
jgi:regulator of protease activity HflC (stomatin/prohibitin superfamily)